MQSSYPFSASMLAHYVVNKCYIEGHPVSNLQLQKILYFLQTIYCQAKHGRELLFPEEFEAWPYGPVLPTVYQEFAEFGGRVIEKKFHVNGLPKDAILMKFVDDGIGVLRKKSPWDLVNISHAQGTPWHRVYRDGSGYKDTISNALLMKSVCEGIY